MLPAGPMSHTTLPNAPITEALIQLRVVLPPEIGVADLGLLQDLIGYPQRNEQISWTAMINPSAPQTIEKESKATKGYIFWSADRLHAVQAQLTSYTCSRLKPYIDWEELRSTARVNWEHYASIARPSSITKVTVRTINRIELPQPVTSFEKYFNTFVRVADGLPQALSGVFLRIAFPSDHATSVVTIVLDAEGITAEKVPIILDIETSITANMDAHSDDAWTALESLRDLKNEVFFKTMTPAALELFK